jgi:DNA polymerase III subunit delta'
MTEAKTLLRLSFTKLLADHNIFHMWKQVTFMSEQSYFSAIYGHQAAIEILTQAVELQRIAPAYLFFGPGGIGKALVARCWVEMQLCANLETPEKIGAAQQKIRQGNHPDLLWIAPTYTHQGKLLSASEAAAAGIKKKAPPQIRIDQIRQITQFLAQPPLIADRAIVVIEQVETMAEGAANALLKTLEEPGSATLILLTDNPALLLPTLISRCQRIPFRRLSGADLSEILTGLERTDILQDEILISLAQGSPGQSIELGENLAAIDSEIKAALLRPISNMAVALGLAKTIDKDVDSLSQLALLEYLQFHAWQQRQDAELVGAIETSRRQLLAYVQPRLVWECLLLAMVSEKKS